MSQQRKDWKHIKEAEKWLRENYDTHPRAVEALRRYESLCDTYAAKYRARPFLHSFEKQGNFDFDAARKKLSEKMPILNR